MGPVETNQKRQIREELDLATEGHLGGGDEVGQILEPRIEGERAHGLRTRQQQGRQEYVEKEDGEGDRGEDFPPAANRIRMPLSACAKPFMPTLFYPCHWAPARLIS